MGWSVLSWGEGCPGRVSHQNVKHTCAVCYIPVVSGVERRICRCLMQKASYSCSLQIFENEEIKLGFQFFCGCLCEPIKHEYGCLPTNRLVFYCFCYPCDAVRPSCTIYSTINLVYINVNFDIFY